MLSKKQIESIEDSDARLNIWEGAVRSSKTVASIIRWLQYIENAPPGELLMTAKTERTLKRNILMPMFEWLDDDDYKDKSGSGELIVFDRLIYLVGANDERAEQKIRGATIAGAYGDELTLWPESYFNMMLSRLSVKGAKFFGTTNPDGPQHWLKKKILERIGKLNLKTWHFMLEDNPFLDQEYVESLKNEYVGLWYNRFILGEWCLAEGSIYDFFDEDMHTATSFPIPDHYAVSIDYGTSNPTAMGLYGVNFNAHPKIWKIKEYYHDSRAKQRQKTDQEYSADLKAFLDGIVPRWIIVDPSAASFRLQLNRDGFGNVVEAINDVLDGIRTQGRMLQNGEYLIHPDCKQTIEDYSAYVWDENAQKKGEDKPRKVNDHTKDEERYILHTLFGAGDLGTTIVGGEIESAGDEW